ncbi:alpha-amylase family protein [Egicoccus halophilus]|uniref:Alpha-amylase n=1 Tax=Egicoccus halophilus TaxID=1670830 RepID=A0A8J3AB62_9ACTN|nr:alpha-amylase family protein [Egicoccus halophilus]GGI07099.1 alpha-amylase [Egicoccus halophilus]
MSSWSDHAIWWHVYPLGFTGAEREALPADASPLPRLRNLEPWLDYLLELGANGLALGPVFASETHGYDTVDHFRIDPRLGTEDDFVRLVERCRSRGIRILLDGVFNHVGRGFGPFRDVLAHGRDSRHADWFRIHWDRPGRDGAPFDHDDFEGHHHLVALDHRNPEVVDHVTDVMRHWLALGADGWRLDAAYAVPPAFWAETIGRVRAHHPEAWFVGEVIHGPYEPWVTGGRLDSVTQYELWKAVWSALNDRNFWELGAALQRHDGFTSTFRPLTFLGNHDVTRIASQLDDERHLGHAQAVQFTVAGVPSVYAGDEQAFTGVKQQTATGDDAVRPPFPERPDELAPFGWPVFQRHQALIALRRRHPWLVRARTRVVTQANEQLAYVSEADGSRVVTLLNVADRGHRFDDARRELGELHLAVSGHGDAPDPWDVPAHSWAVLVEATG